MPRLRIHPAALLLLATAPLCAQSLPPGTTHADSAAQVSPLDAPESALVAQHFADARDQLLHLTAKPLDSTALTARALYDLGFAYDGLNDTTNAEKSYRAAIAAEPEQFEAHAALGMLLMESDPTGARSELATATGLTPAANASSEKAQVYRALARLDARSRPSVASEELLTAVRLTGESPSDALLTAQISESLGDLSDAEAAYRRTLNTPGASTDAAYSLGGLLIRTGNLDGAVSVLQPALIAHPGSAPLAAQLARAYMLQGDDAKAVPLLASQHAQHPEDTATARMLADACSRSGDFPRADALYTQLLAASPDDVALLAARGDELIRAKQFNQAFELLNHAVTLFKANPALLPDNDARATLYASVAFAASETGRPSTVLVALDQRAKYADETPPTLFLRATAHDHLGHVLDARDFYTQFCDAAHGQYPKEVWQAKHRLIALASARTKH